jgi:hypothetical protein
MYFCGYFALSNVPNWEVICIIPIFGIIFGQNVFLWLLWIIKWFKMGSYLHNTNIWGHFWSKFGYLTPWGDHM